MTLAIEHTVSGPFSAANNGSVSMTTGGTDRILIVFVHSETITSATPGSSITCAALTFHLRKALAFNNGGSYKSYLEEWWAYAPSQLTAQTLAVTLTGV